MKRAAAVVALLLVAWQGWTGVWMLERDESGVVQRFGRVDRVVGAGFHLTLPSPFERVTVVRTGLVRPMPIGYRLIDRIGPAPRPPTPEQVEWLTGDTYVVELEADIEYRIEDPVAFLFELGAMSTGEPPDRIVRKLAESEFAARLAGVPVDLILSQGKAALQIDVHDALQRAFDRWRTGLAVVSVQILRVRPPRDVEEAFGEVSSAVADANKAINEADGYARDLDQRSQTEAARATADAEIERTQRVAAARGEAGAFTRLVEEAAAQPALTRRRLLLEVLEETLGRVEMLVVERDGSVRIHRTRQSSGE